MMIGQRSERLRVTTSGMRAHMRQHESVQDWVCSVPTSGQEEEVFALKEINHLQESERVVHKSKRMVASQRVLELQGLI
jgi:hypothetical protein